MSDADAAPESTGERIDALLSDAEERIEALLDADEMDADETVETIEDLYEIADEAEDLLEYVDVSDLIEAVDVEDLPEAIDFEDLPEAIEEGDPEKAIELRKLLSLTELSEVWDSANVRELWREKRELDDAVDDFSEEDAAEDGGLRDGDAFGTGADADADAGVGPESGSLADYDPESAKNAIQAKMSGAVGEFRETLLAANERLEALREANEERLGRRRHDVDSRNPSAFSTLPPARSDMGGAARHSTVPEETRHSSAPNRPRIYGDRFEEEKDDG